MRKAAATLLLALACAAPAAAEPGRTAAPFLNASLGARSAAMGQAFTAVAGGGESLNYNPGALAFEERVSVSASYLRGFGGVEHGFAAVPLPLGAFVLTPGLMYFDAGNMYLNLSNGFKGDVDAEKDRAVYASAAWRPCGRLGLGATLKHVRVELAETASASELLYDAGLLFRAGRGLSFGAALLNSGGEFTFETDGDPAPMVGRLGAAWRVEFTPPNLLDKDADLVYFATLLTADMVKPREEDAYYQAGLELDMDMAVGLLMKLRFGYLFDRPAEGFVFGVGFGDGGWSLDLSFDTGKEMDARQQATLGYRF
ncbi:MAG TPA: PorV/PorQ family protein [Elusimicrobiales bacterium]|nr:PorV/PorQ family protein [Elusimicrobiales bacterium]